MTDGCDLLPVVHAADVADAEPGLRWLVASLWARAGVGILGGAPKCCKSWLALEMAIAVASGTPCLGIFDVGDPGPALLYMAEDAAPVVKTRLLGICRHRGLELARLPIHLITAPALRLDRSRDQVRLRGAVATYAPRLLVLDPFVRLHCIDENDAGQVSALLGYLRELQRALAVAVVVVHHARKNGSAGHPGQSLRGSGDSSRGPTRSSTCAATAVSSSSPSSIVARRPPIRSPSFSPPATTSISRSRPPTATRRSTPTPSAPWTSTKRSSRPSPRRPNPSPAPSFALGFASATSASVRR